MNTQVAPNPRLGTDLPAGGQQRFLVRRLNKKSGMNVEETYYRGAKSFDLWVRLMESHTRKMQVEDSSQRDSQALIISAPTDYGIPLVATSRRDAETNLLCFSDRTARIATEYCSKQGCEIVKVKVAQFFRIPFGDSHFSTVYANCFFDFCLESEIEPILDEIRRVLRVGGSLLTVNMAGGYTTCSSVALGVEAIIVSGQGSSSHRPSPAYRAAGISHIEGPISEQIRFPDELHSCGETRDGCLISRSKRRGAVGLAAELRHYHIPLSYCEGTKLLTRFQ